jgi:transposase-like protein
VSGVKRQVVEMAINGCGIRDTGRVLGINKNTVISTLIKAIHAAYTGNPIINSLGHGSLP